MEDNKTVFVVKLPLKPEIWQQHILNKRFEYCREIYNNLIKKIKRILFYYQNTNEWKEIEKITDFKKKSKLIKEFIKKYNSPLDDKKLSAYTSKKFRPRYIQYGINTTILEFIGCNAWRSLEKYLYGKGKKIAYKEKDTLNSYSIRKKGNFNGMVCDFKKSIIEIKIDNKNNTIIIPFEINPNTAYSFNPFTP